MSIEAMKMALEVLEQINQLSIGEDAVVALPGEIDGAMINLRTAIEQAEKPVAFVQIAPQREWAWMPAPIKTQWGHDMVVADLAIDKDHTVSIYCERDQIKSVEAMFAPQPQQVEKPMAWFHADNYKTRFATDPSEEMAEKDWKPLYTVPRQEQPLKIDPADCHIRVGEVSEPICVGGKEPYDQTSLEMCEECGWKALIPGDGCLVCARQKATPVWIQRNHLESAQREPSMCRVEPTKRLPDFVPLYTEPREWVGLTEIEICDIEADELTSASSETFSFARAIEAKLKEKNHAG